MFDDEYELFKKRGNNVVTTEKNNIWFFKAFFLENKKTII